MNTIKGNISYMLVRVLMAVMPMLAFADTYTLTCDPNGGTWRGSSAPAGISVEIGSNQNNQIGSASRDGLIFEGWFTEKNVKVYDGFGYAVAGTYWSSDNKWQYENDLTVYAHWIEVTEVVRAPLTDARWTQYSPYKEYAPLKEANGDNWAAGCEPVAASQELLVWQWPWSLGAVHESSHNMLGEPFSIRFDGNVPIDWDSLLMDYTSDATLKQKHEAARLILMCQSLLQSQFVVAGTESMKPIPGTMEWYEYDGSVKPSDDGALDNDALEKIRADLEFGSPVQVGVPKHAVVGLGYAIGTNTVGEAVDLIWLNHGWGGGSDGWFDFRNTANIIGISPIQNVQVGFRPIKSVQIEPVPPVCGSDLTINWHLPNCYTNKIDGFVVSKKKISSSTTTWSDNFDDGGKGRTSNSNSMRIDGGGLKAWASLQTAVYTYDEKFLLTEDSVLTYKIGSSYMYGMFVRLEANFDDGGWETVHSFKIYGGNKETPENNQYYNFGRLFDGDPVNLGQYAGRVAQFRIAVGYASGSYFISDDASVKFDDLKLSNVKMYESDVVETIDDIAVRSKKFGELEEDANYAFSVAPIMSDGAVAVTQTVTTVIGTPADKPVINSVSMVLSGDETIQDGFYANIATGWNIINVDCSPSVVQLEAFPSHQSVLPQHNVGIVEKGDGQYSILIDASGTETRWDGQRMILTLKATNATGESAYKDMEICLDSTVQENIPSGIPSIDSVSMMPKGVELVQNGYSVDIAMGWNIIDVECTDAISLVAVPEYTTVLPQEKVSVVDKGDGKFSVLIDANDVAAKWNGQMVPLTLKAANDAGEASYKELELCLKASGVPEYIPSDKTKTVAAGNEGDVCVQGGGTLVLTLDEEQAMYGYTASGVTLESGANLQFVYNSETVDAVATDPLSNKPIANVYTPSGSDYEDYDNVEYWSSGRVADENDDYVAFNISKDTTICLTRNVSLKNVMIKGSGILTFENWVGSISIDKLQNTTPVVLNSALTVGEFKPSANIILSSDVCLDCDITSSYAGFMKYKNDAGDYVSALTNSVYWKGTVVFDGYTAAGQSPSDYGNTESTVRFNGVSGWLANNTTFNPAIELMDDGTTPALNWNNGSTGAKETIKKLKGSGTFKTSGSGGAAERVVINDVDDFTGSFDLSLKRIAIGTADPTTSNNGSITVNSSKSITVHGGSTWKASGGFYFGGSQTIAVNGTLNGAITANGTGTVLSLAPTATVMAASLSFANNTIRLAKTAEASPTFSVTGAANLAGATIEVSLADGMSAGDSIALLSAGSFAGVDSATLTGLDGYSLAVEDGILYAKMDECVYTGPEPTAVWEAGEFKRTKNGYSIELNGNTIDADGNIVIDGSSSAGATINLTDVVQNATKITVLYKYKTMTAPNNADCRYAVSTCYESSSEKIDMGLINWNNTNPGLLPAWHKNNGSTMYDNAFYKYSDSKPAYTQAMSANGGYVLFSFSQDAKQLAGYQGAAINNLEGGVKDGISFTGYNKLSYIGLGGPTGKTVSNKWGAWPDLVIEKVAIFVGEAYTQEDLAGYEFPDAPIDPDEYSITPAAVWCKDFKTTTKGEYTLTTSGSTVVADDKYGSTLTIGDAAAVIDTTAAATSNMTVLIKYRAASNVVNAPVAAFGGYAKSGNNLIGLDVGVYTKSDKTLAVYRNFNADNGKPYNFSADPVLSATGGYVLCARNNSKSCMVYVGDALDMMTGSVITNNNIQFSNIHLTSLGVGGSSNLPANANDMVPFTGLVVEKIVIFSGYYTPDQIRYVPNPEDGDTVNIADNTTWTFTASDTPREYTSVGTLSSSGTIAIANASELTEGTYPLATWTTPQQCTTLCAGYGKVGTLVTEGLAAGLSARLVYGARAIYLRVDDTAKQAARKPLVILPYGDSITEGFNAQHTGANYRILLYQKLELLGFNVKSAGIYGLDDGYNSVDPTGTALTDQYRWHSAKHGAVTGRSTATGSGRGDLEENVDTVCAQAGKPDAVLLHIGINDLVSHDRVDTTDLAKPVYISWSNVVWRLVKDLPETKIVVSTVLYGSGGQATRKITKNNVQIPLTDLINDFNDRIKNSISDFPEGHVFLADLNAYVKSTENGILYDGTHPDWWGYDQMAEGWLSVITNQFSASQSQNFPSATPIVAPTSDKLGAAAKEELADYINGFKRYAVIEGDKNILPTLETAIPYSQVNNDAATTDIKKVGYFVEYVRNDNNVHKWVWVDMDAFGDTIEEVGLPKAKHQCVVSSLHVKSNHGAIDDVPANDDTVKGFVEFSPFDYSAGTSNVEGGPKDYSCYDWNDTLSDSGSKSCMQVHRIISSTSAPGGQVLFAYNNWRSESSEAEFGIGNFSQHFHRGTKTFDYSETTDLATMNASAYSIKRIEIWTKAAEPEPTATNTEFPTPHTWIDTYFPDLVEGWSSTQYNDFATNKNHSSVKNGYAPWESYVLGLVPTEEDSKFEVSIRMDGQTPIVEYSPTNTTLDIKYVLQGNMGLSDEGWSDCPSFDEPGDTNRFFRVKVTW